MMDIKKHNTFIGVEGTKTNKKIIKLKNDKSIIENIGEKTILNEDGRELLKG